MGRRQPEAVPAADVDVDVDEAARLQRLFVKNARNLSRAASGGGASTSTPSTPTPAAFHPPAAASSGGCPVIGATGLNEKNMMPVDNNKPMFGEQAKPLDATRAVSSIPTGSDDASAEKWVYPSPQMFYNAMRRKNWQPAEEDMNAIVAIHNATNERVWWVLDSRTLSAVRSFDARLSFRASIFYCLTA